LRWSWTIGRLAGIEIRIHATFGIIVAWVAFSYWMVGRTLLSALIGALFILALFGCVVLHELGHALMARRFGIRTRDITLWPIGGVARLERLPDRPSEELRVAIAGPLVNLVIAGLLWLVLPSETGSGTLAEGNLAHASFLQRLLVLNAFLALFNLLPAFPMDGGRILRALLATRLSHVRATELAAQVGQGMAVMFGLGGLLVHNPFLLFIALFVWLGAYGEAAAAQMQAAFSGIPVSRAMITDFEVLAPRAPLSRAVELTLAGTQADFPVVDDGRVVGILRQADLMAGLSRQGPEAPVEGWMCRRIQPVDPQALLDRVFLQLQQSECRTLPVVRAGELVGLLTPQNLGEFVQIEAALRSSA